MIACMSVDLIHPHHRSPAPYMAPGLAGVNKPAGHVHSPRTVSSSWELRTMQPLHNGALKSCKTSPRCVPCPGQADAVPLTCYASPCICTWMGHCGLQYATQTCIGNFATGNLLKMSAVVAEAIRKGATLEGSGGGRGWGYFWGVRVRQRPALTASAG